jgi:hypothetical protein
MRAVLALLVCALVVPLGGWAHRGASPAPPRKCGPASNELHATLQTLKPGPLSHAVRYFTYCGPAKAIIRHDGTTFGLHPGHCVFEAGQFHAVALGALAVRDAVAMPMLGITFRPTVGAGTFKLAETATGYVHGLVQVPGVRGIEADGGTVTVNDGLRSGTFAFRVNGERVTGSWTCG